VWRYRVELDTINEFSDLLRTKNLPYDARSSLIDPRKPSTRMDVAKRLAEWRDQPPEQWFTTVNRYLPPGVTAVLVIAIAYQLSTLTWTLVPGSMPVAAPAPRSVAPGGTAPPSDYSVLANSHLFGEAAEQAAPVAAAVVDAPDTTLSLTLRGILSKEGDPNGSVIIEGNRGESKTYFVGQSIDGADGATLHSVYAERVLLNRSGRLETLRLPKELTPSGGSPMASPLPRAAQPAALREVISDNAGRLADIIRPVPHVQEGQVVGFRVNPGRDRAAFEALGLQPNDVVTDINGTVLDDPSQGLQVFQSLGEATQANVTVLRDGVPQVIVIDTSQLQRLQENRE
jgi:general secretion pathway protein C